MKFSELVRLLEQNGFQLVRELVGKLAPSPPSPLPQRGEGMGVRVET